MSEQQIRLVVDPLTLHLKFIANQPSTAQISLHNPTKDRIAFTIKPNQPTRYYIKIQSGYVDPEETFQVDIHMHAQSEAPNDVNMDKFMVQFVPVGRGETLITPEMFNRDLPQSFARDLPPVGKVEVSVVLEEHQPDENNVEQSSQSFVGLLNQHPKRTKQEAKTLFTKNVKDDKDVTRDVQDVKSIQNKSPQNNEIQIEMGKVFQGAEVGGQNPLNPQKINEQTQKNNENVIKGLVEIPIHQEDDIKNNNQDDILSRGDSSSTSTNIQKDQIDVQNGTNKRSSSFNRKSSRSNIIRSGSEFFQDILQKDLISGRVFLTFPLDLLFPKAIRAYSAQIVQILLGLIIFISSFVYFWLLFAKFRECQIYNIETAGEPKNAIRCDPRFIDHDVLRALSVDGIWDANASYNVQNAGPWQFKFDAYKADNETFMSNINNLLEEAQKFMTSQQNKTFIETLGAALFFSKNESGINGTVELTANIDHQMVFDNYDYKRFSFINQKKELLESVDQGLNASISAEQQLPPSECVENCRGELTIFEDQYYCQTLAQGSTEITGDLGDLTYIAPSVPYANVFKDMYFPNTTLYQSWADTILKTPSLSIKNVRKMLAYPDRPFTSQFNIQEMFIINYCNNDGKKYCREAMEKVMKQDELDDWFYTWIPGFWGELSSNIKGKGLSVGFRQGVAKNEIYINSLGMFGTWIGKKEVLPQKGGPNTVHGLVMVPQLIQFDQQDGKMVCRSCQEPDPYLNTTNCQKNIYNPTYQKLTAQETVEKFYVTSFIHGLESSLRTIRLARKYRDDSQEPDISDSQTYNFFYNNKFASVNNLHCEGSSQWAFKQDIQFEIPFLQETGINSCEVKDCPSWLEALGKAWANVELAFLVFILILSIIILIIQFNLQRGYRDTEEGVVSCRETLAALIDQIRNR